MKLSYLFRKYGSYHAQYNFQTTPVTLNTTGRRQSYLSKDLRESRAHLSKGMTAGAIACTLLAEGGAEQIKEGVSKKKRLTELGR